MRKVIRGRLYDTETAEKIGEWAYTTEDERLLDYFTESLYRKRTGEYFLHGAGGGDSKYGKDIGHGIGTGSGEKIVPLSPANARRWAEEHLPGDEYAARFGKGRPDVQLATNVSAEAKEKIEETAVHFGVSQRNVIEDVFERMTFELYRKLRDGEL